MMKKIIFLGLLVVGGLNLQAQTETDQIREQLKAFSQQFEHFIQGFQGQMGESMMLMDTLIVKGIDPLSGTMQEWESLQPDTMNLNGIMDLFQGQMQQFSEQDWGELQKMMEKLGQQMPMFPTPEPRKNSENSRKSYDL